MRLVTIPDFNGYDAPYSIAAYLALFQMEVPTLVGMLIFRELSGKQSTARIGDQNVSWSNGIPLGSLDALILPVVPPQPGSHRESNFYDLTKVFLLASSRDIISIGMIIGG